MHDDKDIYEIHNDTPEDYDGYDEDELNGIIDEEIKADYEQCEWACNCGCKFNTEEATIDDANNISCPACGEIVMCDEFRIEND